MSDARARLDAEVSEAALQAAIVRTARLLGYRCYHPWTSVHSERGWPDLVLCRERPDGTTRVIVAELKRADGVVSREQQAWLDLLGRCPGIEAVVWRPADWSAGVVERVLGEDA